MKFNFLILSAVTVLLFQNCVNSNRFRGQSATETTNSNRGTTASNNGAGYNGKLTYSHVAQDSRCQDGNKADTIIEVEVNASWFPIGAQLVRENCVSLSSPKTLVIGDTLTIHSDLKSANYGVQFLSLSASDQQRLTETGLTFICSDNSGFTYVMKDSYLRVQRTLNGSLIQDSGDLGARLNGTTWDYGNDSSDPEHYVHFDTQSDSTGYSLNLFVLSHFDSSEIRFSGRIPCYVP